MSRSRAGASTESVRRPRPRYLSVLNYECGSCHYYPRDREDGRQKGVFAPATMA